MYGSMLDDEQQQQQPSAVVAPPSLSVRALDDLAGQQQHGTAKKSTRTTQQSLAVDEAAVYRLFRDDNCQDSNSNNVSAEEAHNALADCLRLASLLARQLLVAIAVSEGGPGGAQLWVDYRCDHVLSRRAPPYELQDDGTIVLLQNLSYPVSSSTISVSLLMWTAVWIPLMVTIVCGWLFAGKNAVDEQRRVISIPLASLQCCCNNGTVNLSIPSHRLLETAAAVSGLLTCLGLSEGLTRLGKASFQRRRPNFYEFCGFDSATQQCAGTKYHICEAQYGLPSGHASLTCCAMTYLSCYFCGKILSSTNQHLQRCKMLWCTVICTLLLSYAVFVAATRVTNHWHNPGDVIAGLILGGVSAFAVYHLYYTPLWNARAAGTPRTVWAWLVESPSSALQLSNESGDVGTISATGERTVSPSQPAKLGGQQTEFSDLPVVLV